jgi:hypothetical protein
MPNFVLVVEGEVAGNFTLPDRSNAPEDVANSFEKMVAIFSSDPKIIVSDVPVEEGLLWNGEGFIKP